MSDKEFKLCYYDGTFFWFSQRDPKEIFGDDWNDRPHECNAGEPYSEFGPFKKIAVDGVELRAASYGYENSPFSAQDINEMNIPWVTSSPYADVKFGLLAGTTYEECIKIFLLAGAEVYIKMEVV